MYCTRCGAYNADELTFCANCAEKLNKPGGTQKQQGAPGTSQNPYSYTNPTMAQQPHHQNPAQNRGEPYPGFQSGYNPSQGYQPYQSSYASQMQSQGGGASGRAIASLILSVLSLVTCGPVFSIPGLILGKMEMNAIRDGQAPKSGEALAKIGFYLGIAATAIFCAVFGLWLIIAAIGSIGQIQ